MRGTRGRAFVISLVDLFDFPGWSSGVEAAGMELG